MNTVRDENGKWINPDVFREPALAYIKKNYYISDPPKSPAWYTYWKEQRRRCIEGYTVDGVRIPGEFYFYLNFCPIQKVEDPTAKITKKINSFPDFWDGDFTYFWCRSIARYGITASLEPEVRDEILALSEEEQVKREVEEFKKLKLPVDIEDKYLKGNQNFIVGKSRRKGYSYKAASIAACNYFTKPKSLTIFGAYEKKYLYPKGLFTMSIDYINFINENTGWGMPSDIIEKQDHRKGSYVVKINGISIEKGFKSEIMALTFKDNADAARGKDAVDIFFEESGAFGTPELLKNSYAASEDCVMAGVFKTGMITVFGTSGDMGGGTADYADMFNRPQAFGFMPFKNVWEKGLEDTDCGFFHPIQWNMEGTYDKFGNSDMERAMKIELDLRKKLIANGATSAEIQKRMQEKPLNPSEAFATVSVNTFPVVELKHQLKLVNARGWQKSKGTPMNLSYRGNGVIGEPILDGSERPITSYNTVPTDIRGNVMVYEPPVHNAAKGLYKIGYDPIRQDEGSSLAAIIVYKGVHTGTLNHSIIVAEYIGRLSKAEDIDDLAAKIAMYYNTTIMHENEVPAVKNYFRRRKLTHLLAEQPNNVITKNIKKSKTNRIFGCHMNLPLKDAGERYVTEWLLTVLDFNEHQEPIRVIDKIYSVRLLEELIAYNRKKGNFDLVSALFMCMFQVQEGELGAEYGEKKENKNIKKVLSMYENMYKI